MGEIVSDEREHHQAVEGRHTEAPGQGDPQYLRANNEVVEEEQVVNGQAHQAGQEQMATTRPARICLEARFDFRREAEAPTPAAKLLAHRLESRNCDLRDIELGEAGGQGEDQSSVGVFFDSRFRAAFAETSTGSPSAGS